MQVACYSPSQLHGVLLFEANMRRKLGLVAGVGVNDCESSILIIVDGEICPCPFYKKWADMLRRCYSTKFHARQPMYLGSSVCNEWLAFSNFKAWMQSQNWQGMVLDKDIIKIGNKVYCPDYCAFVSAATNNFITSRDRFSSKFGTGVFYVESLGAYRATCSNPFSGKREVIGYFKSSGEANAAWKRRKHELSLELSKQQKDPRVSEALINRYK